MTARMVPDLNWGTAVTEQFEMPTQQYACADCGVVSPIIKMVSGTIYCAQHGPELSPDVWEEEN